LAQEREHVISGDDRFEALYARYFGDVLAYALRRAPRALAQDVAADTFLVVWRRLDDVPDNPLPWLLAVARKSLANQRRSARRQRALTERLAAEPRQEAVRRHELDGPPILTALARLGERDQEVLMLTAWEELDSRQAGKVLGCSPTAYRLRLLRARRKLEHALEELKNDEAPGAIPNVRMEERC
jgi:RNA polymerase sigma-70 factor, ECF subfamily